MVRKISPVSIIFIFSIIFAGCTLETSGLGPAPSGNRSFIDAPLDGTISEVFIPIAFTTHANFRVERIILLIEKEPSDPSSRIVLEQPAEVINPQIFQADFSWTPVNAGRYKIMAYSFTDGRINDWDTWTTHTIHLTINERATGGGSEVPTAMPNPAPTQSVSTPLPAPQVNFWADAINLTSGACTYLRWDSVYVESLTLQSEAVAFIGSRQICPSSTTTYLMIGRSPAGEVEKTLTISVTPPAVVKPPTVGAPDTNPPTISNLSQSAVEIFDNASCGPVNNMISVKIQDPDGIAKVELYYRAKTAKITGTWQSISMSGSGTYSASLGSAELTSSLANYVPSTIEFMVKAWDKSNNMSQSAQMTFKAQYCLF